MKTRTVTTTEVQAMQNLFKKTYW